MRLLRMRLLDVPHFNFRWDAPEFRPCDIDDAVDLQKTCLNFGLGLVGETCRVVSEVGGGGHVRRSVRYLRGRKEKRREEREGRR